MINPIGSGVHILAILLISLLAGSMFGIWRGYDPVGFTVSTFVEVHQGSVRGLNILLPAMGGAALVLVLILAFINRGHTSQLAMFGIAALMMVAAGLITRLINQPINADIMQWTAATVPADWTSVRDNWWNWHIARMCFAVIAEVVLLLALVLKV